MPSPPAAVATPTFSRRWWMRLVRTSCVVALAVGLIMFAAPRPVTFVAGAVLLLCACLLRIWAFGHLDKNGDQVTTGPYAYTRNPAYLGSFLGLLGLSLAAGNGETRHGLLIYGVALLGIVAFFFFYLPRKYAREYTRLETRFGERFREHAANVPDLWPRLTPWHSGDGRRWSFALVSTNHEWPWGLAFAAALTAIWFVHTWSPAYRMGWIG